ncbi:NF038122 family metalloprotease [Moorena sp. SIO3H5]|uniref:NF038122 family metalloprotease n=1 Tax=Moorena sp. SIO3H5 TaxID=2607834 RepID=UPI0013BB22BD|nr:NF038122 family metalloprotease [Moorena sp. SIO3H5]NEO68970.1 hypothetical protein [Moorena sp. SIO3H5]
MKNRQVIMSLSLASAAVIGGNAPAQAIDFDFSYQPGTSLEQMLGFQMAGEIWSYYLTDDITVKIHVEMTNDLPSNILGGALPGLQKNKKYKTFRKKMKFDKTSKDDDTAYNKLQRHDDDGEYLYRVLFESGSDWYNNNIALTNANAKAINYHSNNSLLDGYIVMNDTFNWSYDYQRNAPTPSNAVDFLSVGMHEIGHILGFVSAVDSTKLADHDASEEINLNRLMRTTALDMYRRTHSTPYYNNKIDLTYGANAYFSIDGGKTALAYFSEGKDLNLGDGGDGYQASHWDGLGDDLGIMKPALGWGERADISPLDLRAFDVIGFDLNSVVFGSDGLPSESNMTLNLNNLLNNAKNTLADKIGDYLNDSSVNASSIDWYIANDNETAGSWLTEDRIQDVIDMYEWGHSGGGGGGGSGGSGGGGSSGGGGNGSGQVLGQLVEQEGFFNDFNWSTFNPDQGVAQVPESGATSGLIGLGLLGIGGVFKGRRR